VLPEITITLAIAVVAIALAVAFRYLKWRSSMLRTLKEGSQVAETRVGLVEYVLKGDAGPVTLFLHGMPGGYNQAPELQREGTRLLAPSRPGYLRTPLRVGGTPEEQARVYEALIDALGIDRVLVMGASGGGPSAVAFAAMYPERTDGLILLEAVTQSFPNDGKIMPVLKSDFLYWFSVSAILKTAGAKGLIAAQVPDKSNQRRILDSPARLADFERVVWSIWPMSMRLEGYRNDLAQIDELSLAAGQVSSPTLIVHGTADALVPFEQSETLADQIAGATLHAVENADHMMPITHRDELNSIIGDFLLSIRD
jgi:pimeloyl-ACP methyl ester carboxylesterase